MTTQATLSSLTMRTRWRSRVCVAGLLVVTSALSSGAQPQRLITEADLLKFVWAADPQISPDGAHVVFTRVVVNEQKDEYESSLWIVPSSGGESPRRLTSGSRDSAARWSPDGKHIAFVRAIERDSRPQPGQIYLLGFDGGEARPITDLARGASAPVWSPDGQRIAFSSTTRADDAITPETGAAPKSDVRIVTSATYRSNGGGWNDPARPPHIWVTAMPVGPDLPKPTQLTSGNYSEGGHIWSSDGDRIFFTSTRVDEPYYAPDDSNIYSVSSSGGPVTELASIDGGMGSLQRSPDGRSIAFIGTLNGSAERSYSQSDLFIVDLQTHVVRNLTTSYDFDIGGSVGGDQAPPRGGATRNPIWSGDGKSIVVVAGEQGNANLVRFDLTRPEPQHVYRAAHTVLSYTASKDGRIVVLRSTPTIVGDLFVLAPGADTVEPRQITRVNDDVFRNIKLSEPEEIWWTSFDGKKIQGWLLHPPDFDRTRSGAADKKYPLILQIHGGPHSAYGNVFTHEFHWMAAKGYVVLFPNPRGSSNYGQEFGNIIQYRYPGDDYKDLMAGVDAVLKRGYIDEKRLGVTGGSGGGLLTNWTITQTTRFAAAVSQRSIADWSGFWYTADFTLFTPTWFRKAPWEDAADFTARSPITHVAKVKTPLMLIEGDDDLRTPPSDGGEMMFRALKYLKVPTVMVRFPTETHELSRSGKPRHRIERLQHIVGWFDKWLQGAKLYETMH